MVNTSTVENGYRVKQTHWMNGHRGMMIQGNYKHSRAERQQVNALKESRWHFTDSAADDWYFRSALIIPHPGWGVEGSSTNSSPSLVYTHLLVFRLSRGGRGIHLSILINWLPSFSDILMMWRWRVGVLISDTLVFIIL